MQTRDISLLVALLGVLLLIGCMGHSTLPEDGKSPEIGLEDLPYEIGLGDFPERFVDELPKGTASFEGRIVLTTPELLINGSSLEPSLECKGMLGLFRSGSSQVGRLIPIVSFQRDNGDDSSNWFTPFSFEEIPLGEYQVRLFRILESDFNLYNFVPYLTSEPIIVNGDLPSGPVGDLRFTMLSSEGTGSIKGKLIVEGYLEPTLNFNLFEGFDSSSGWAIYWKIPFYQNDNGRLEYELRGLPPASYRFGERILIGNVVADYGSSDYSALLADGATLVTDIITNTRSRSPDSSLHNRMSVDLKFDELEWTGNLVVVVEKEGGATNRRELHRSLVTKHAITDLVKKRYNIRDLDATFNYTVKAFLLGENPGESQLVGQYPGVVEFVTTQSGSSVPIFPLAKVGLVIELD